MTAWTGFITGPWDIVYNYLNTNYGRGSGAATEYTVFKGQKFLGVTKFPIISIQLDRISKNVHSSFRDIYYDVIIGTKGSHKLEYDHIADIEPMIDGLLAAINSSNTTPTIPCFFEINEIESVSLNTDKAGFLNMTTISIKCTREYSETP